LNWDLFVNKYTDMQKLNDFLEEKQHLLDNNI